MGRVRHWGERAQGVRGRAATPHRVVHLDHPHELHQDINGHRTLIRAAVQVPLQHAEAGRQSRGPGGAV